MTKRRLAAVSLCVILGALAFYCWFCGDVLPGPVSEPPQAQPVRTAAQIEPRASPEPDAPPSLADRPPRIEQPKRAPALTPEAHRALVASIRGRLGGGSSPAGEPLRMTETPAGSLDPTYIREAMHEIRPLLRGCYDRALALDPRLSGKLVVQFTIIGDEELGGVVAVSEIVEDQTNRPSPSLVECIRETKSAE